MLFDKVDNFNSDTCFITGEGKEIIYKDILKKADALSKDLTPRSLIFVLSENNTQTFTGYLSFFRKGLVQMLLNSKISDDILEKLIKTYLPNYIYSPISKSNVFKNYEILNKSEKYILLQLNKDNNYSINKDLALLLSTSGSTGSKKFVRISYENIYNNTKDIVKFLKINKNQKTITTMPPFYTYGLSIINTHLYTGASIVVTNLSTVEKKFWGLLNNQKVTSFGGVPYFYEILKKIKFDKLNLPHLQYFTQAGGALKKDLIKYFLDYSKKNNKKFIIMYGQTEATARMTYLPYKMSRKKIGSIGLPIPGGKITLRKNKNSSDQNGEIIYEGKNVSMGYAKNFKDLIKKDENCGKLSTGDFATKDNDGYFYITGRKSRDVKLFGHRVSLDEIEQILSKKGYNCFCCGGDNKVVIFHINKDYNEKILKYLSLTTKINLNCFKLKRLKTFPINENGKVSYNQLKDFL